MKIKGFKKSYIDSLGHAWPDAVIMPKRLDICSECAEVTYEIFRNEAAYKIGVAEARERYMIKDEEFLNEVFTLFQNRIKSTVVKYKTTEEVEVDASTV